MQFHTHQKGQSLIEILFAAAIFTMSVVTIGYLVLDASVSVREQNEALEARLLAGEGIVAVQALRDQGFDALTPGTHGLVWNGAAWELEAASDQVGIFTRRVIIEEQDEEVREVRVEVDTDGARQRTLSLTTLVSNWHQNSRQAGQLSGDAGAAQVSSSTASLLGVTVENGSSSPVVIDAIRMSWDHAALLERVSWNGAEVWNASTTPVSSGTLIDIEDIEIAGLSGPLTFDSFDFNGNIGGAEFILTLICSDGSMYHIGISV